MAKMMFISRGSMRRGLHDRDEEVCRLELAAALCAAEKVPKSPRTPAAEIAAASVEVLRFISLL